MSEKMTTPGLLKIKMFLNKSYYVIIYVHEVINKIYHVIQIVLQIYSCDQSLVALAFL